MKYSRRQFGALTGAVCAGAGFSQTFAAPAPREVPWLNEILTPPAALPSGLPRLPSVLIDGKKQPITTRDAWNAHRTPYRQEWLNWLGMWQRPAGPPRYEILTSDRVGGIVRRFVQFDVELGITIDAYLLLPSGDRTRLPGVVVFHSTVDYTIRQGAGLEGPPAAAWGLKLAQQGFVVLCPRCFLWNDSPEVDYKQRVAEFKSRHPESRSMARMVFDGQRALDLLASLPEVDPQRLGVAGHSLGAKEALYVAAFDDRVKAAVSSEGGIGTTFSNWDASWYLETKEVPREHHDLLALIAPRAFLLIGGDSADGARSWPFIEAALPVYKLYAPITRLGLLNHGQGHTIPPIAEARTYEWLRTYV